MQRADAADAERPAGPGVPGNRKEVIVSDQGPPPALATLTPAADLLGVAVERVREWAASGQVRSERINGELYVSLDDVALLADEAERRGEA